MRRQTKFWSCLATFVLACWAGAAAVQAGSFGGFGPAQGGSGGGGGGGVTSITGTAHEIIASSSTGAVTLSAPQGIDTTSTPQFAGLGVGTAAPSVGLAVAAPSAGTMLNVTDDSANVFFQVSNGDVFVRNAIEQLSQAWALTSTAALYLNNTTTAGIIFQNGSSNTWDLSWSTGSVALVGDGTVGDSNGTIEGGNFLAGTGAASTTSTYGFLSTQGGAGVATGTPGVLLTGSVPLYVNTSAGTIEGFYGAAWHSLGGSGGSLTLAQVLTNGNATGGTNIDLAGSQLLFNGASDGYIQYESGTVNVGLQDGAVPESMNFQTLGSGITTTSGSVPFIGLAPQFHPTSSSSAAYESLSLTTIYNVSSIYTASSCDLYIARTEAALGSGGNYFIEGFAGSAGTTAKFYIDNGGNFLTYGASGYQVSSASASNVAIQSFVTGDSFDRYKVLVSGLTAWGPGSAGTDVTLSRGAANTLYVGNSNTSNVAGFIAASGLSVGNGTPVTTAGTISWVSGLGAFTAAAPHVLGPSDQTFFLSGASQGTTSAGTAVTISGGAGGSTSGASGAVTIQTTQPTSGGAGGLITIQSGSGPPSTSSITTYNGGGLTLATGAGQATTSTGGAVAGNGGALSSTTGAGGASSGTSFIAPNTGGFGGGWSLTTGAGGAASNGFSNAGGNGGAISLTAGSGGAGATTTGSGGTITLSAGASGTSMGGPSLTLNGGAATPGLAQITGGAGSGSNAAGGGLLLTTGIPTGTGTSNFHLQTGFTLASGSTAQTLGDRLFIAGHSVTMSTTTATATTITTLNVPKSGSGGGCIVYYNVVATDGTNYSTATGSFSVSAVNKAGTVTASAAAITDESSVNSGADTLTAGTTSTSVTSTAVAILVAPAWATLVPTSVTCTVTVTPFGNGVTVTPD